MANRKALLIGVPEHDSDPKLHLPVVRTDIAMMQAALEASGYEVIVRGLEGGGRSRSQMLRDISSACRETRPGDTLLVYISSHGINYGGVDYLIPWDGAIDDVDDYKNHLVPVDFANAVNGGRADTTIFFIDACREGLQLKSTAKGVGVGFGPWGTGQRERAKERRYGVMLACEAGGYAHFTDGGFSLFTKSLAEALDPSHPARTVGEVFTAAQQRLNQLSSEHGKSSQTIQLKNESGADEADSILTREICDGIGPAPPRWLRAVQGSPLWRHGMPGHEDEQHALRQATETVVAAVTQDWMTGTRALPDDPWRDERFPERVVDCLDLLIAQSSPDGGGRPNEAVLLRPAEIALLLCAPFVREAILARALAEATEANPRSLEPTGLAEGVRGRLERVHRESPNLIRAANKLAERDDTAAHDAVAIWLLYQFVTRETMLPDAEPIGSLPEATERALTTLTTADDVPRVVPAALHRDLLLALARCIRTDPEWIAKRFAGPAGHAQAGGYDEPHRIRLVYLANLLCLAGRLAIDIRALPDAIPEHGGLTDPLTPSVAIDAINDVRWDTPPGSRTLTLTLACPHPALDMALHEHVRQTSASLSLIRTAQTAPPDIIQLLNALPPQVADTELRPTSRAGRETYVQTRPPAQFQLAHDEIRELLMGEQLYGDPSFAIRELYQNALDACRYRAARQEYLARTRPPDPRSTPWVGEIHFVQGVEHGRPYIECVDNGIGMGLTEITQCFARAGRRFYDLPEFFEDEWAWKQLDPKIELFPNSRFGIGVFSYFMLADELLVETCRFGRHGETGRAYRVHISGSGSLFRIEELDPGAPLGSRVRLYLSKTEHAGQPISCMDTLRELLRVAEFRTTVRELAIDSGEYWDTEEWPAGELHDPAGVYGDIGTSGTPDVWWVSKQGELLADGLRTETPVELLVANLRSERRPTLAVDRRRLLEWDRSWLPEVVRQEWRSIAAWPKLTAEWLTVLTARAPDLADLVFDELVQQGAHLQGAYGGDVRSRAQGNRPAASPLDADVAAIGWLAGEALNADLHPRLRDASWIGRHRANVYNRLTERAGHALSGSAGGAWFPAVCRPHPSDALLVAPEQVEQWQPIDEPVPRGEDGQARRFRAGEALLGSSQVTIWTVLRAAAISGAPLGVVLRRLRRFAPLGLTLPEIDLGASGEMTVSEQELEVIAPDQDEYDGDSQPSGWSVSCRQIVEASARLRLPIGEVIARLQRFVPLGLTLPEIDLNALAEIVVSRQDESMLQRVLPDGDLDRQLATRAVSALALMRVSAELRRPIGALMARLQNFVSLGLTLPEVEPDTLASMTLSDDDVILLSRDLDGHEPWIEETVSLFHLLRASIKTHRPIGDVVTQLRRFAPLGLALPEVAPDVLADLTVSDDDLVLLSRDLDGLAPWIEEAISLHHLLRASEQLRRPVGEIVTRLQRFAPLGITLPALAPELLASPTASDDLALLSRDLDGSEPWIEGAVSPLHLIKASAQLHQPIGVIRERLKRLAPLGVTLPDADLSDLDSFVATDDDVDLLSTADDNDESDHPEIDLAVSPFGLVRLSARLRVPIGALLERLRRLTPLGVALPEIDPRAMDGLTLSYDDRFILSRNINNEPPWIDGAVSPLHLIRASTWSGRPIGEIIVQLQRFVPLGLTLPAVDPNDLDSVTVGEDDLRAFSVNFDGQQPWIEVGSVSSQRVLATAMYLVEPIAVTLDRFGRLEPLGFSAPAERTVINACRQILEDAELWPWPGYDVDGNPLDRASQP